MRHTPAPAAEDLPVCFFSYGLHTRCESPYRCSQGLVHAYYAAYFSKSATITETRHCLQRSATNMSSERALISFVSHAWHVMCADSHATEELSHCKPIVAHQQPVCPGRDVVCGGAHRHMQLIPCRPIETEALFPCSLIESNCVEAPFCSSEYNCAEVALFALLCLASSSS